MIIDHQVHTEVDKEQAPRVARLSNSVIYTEGTEGEGSIGLEHPESMVAEDTVVHSAKVKLPPFDERRYQQLIEERGRLVDKKYEEGLSELERRRLELLEFQIHQYQLARDEDAFSKLQEGIRAYERLAFAIEAFIHKLEEMGVRSRH